MRCPVFALLALLLPAAVQAGEAAYPLRPVRVLVSAPAGGTSDLLARVLSAKLSEQMGQQFIIDNRAGAGGVLAAELLAKSAPDGYTLGLFYTSFTTNAALQKNPSYDPMKDYAAVSLLMWSPLVLVAAPELAVNSVGDLIALSKSKALTYASNGNGSGSHMAGELFKSLTGIQALHVPYKGAAMSRNDVVAGQVQYAFLGPAAVDGLVKAGRLRLLGVTSLKRDLSMRDVPTLDEQGVRGFEVVNWFGIVAPARTPNQRVRQLQREMSKALQAADVRQKLGGESVEIIASDPDEFRGFIKRDIEKWRAVVKSANITVD